MKIDDKKLDVIAERMVEKARELDWDTRGITEDDHEVKIILTILDIEYEMEQKFSDLENKIQDLVNNGEFVKIINPTLN